LRLITGLSSTLTESNFFSATRLSRESNSAIAGFILCQVFSASAISRFNFFSFQVLSADSGLQTLELIKEFDIRLILLDWMMPGMDGLETLGHIRKKYSLADLPVIMVTAKTEEEDMVSSFKNGVNDYITKPVNKAVAMARIFTQYSLVNIRKKQLESEARFKLLSDMSTEGVVFFFLCGVN
jgi:PleD family two-component response regulator